MTSKATDLLISFLALGQNPLDLFKVNGETVLVEREQNCVGLGFDLAFPLGLVQEGQLSEVVSFPMSEHD